MTDTPDDRDYALAGSGSARRIAAPVLDYAPRDPKSYRPNIGLIGCGGITQSHLKAYKSAGYEVVALCDLDIERCKKRQEQFYPKARIYSDYKALLGRTEIEVVDIATHPEERAKIIEGAINAGKHVLSQKPFVLDLDEGERLVRLAQARGVRLAVNQNGRWAPHFSYLRNAVQQGLLGDLLSIHARVHWDHTWIAKTPFEEVDDVILYDFGIHWFDLVASLLGDRKVNRVLATRSRAVGQTLKPPMLAEVLIDFDGGQGSLVFDACLPYGALDQTFAGGTKGSLVCTGPSLSEQRVTLSTKDGVSEPDLLGTWFDQGFHGTMAELLCSIEENRQPTNNAEDNLKSLALCFAAIASAHDGEAKVPGLVRRLPE